jgi:hypothetical protein
MKIHGLLTLVCFILFSICAHAQIITGKVTNADNGNPIANASIYLNGTSKGTSSDSEGKFTLVTNEHTIPLVISCVGYQSQTLDNYSTGNLSIALKTKQLILPEVVIGGISREEQLKIFLTQFLGAISKNCTISNTIDINFNYHKKAKTLDADASEPLIIYNKKLGYKITYFLSVFKYAPEGLRYGGNYFFTEDTVGLSAKELKKIHDARNMAYLGSRMHFIRSLWANRLDAEGFLAYYGVFNTTKYIVAKTSIEILKYEKHLDYSDLIKNGNVGQRFINISQPIRLNYGAVETSGLRSDGSKGSDGLEIISSDGYYDPGIVWSGSMADQRVNVLLPYEFMPSSLSVLEK